MTVATWHQKHNLTGQICDIFKVKGSFFQTLFVLKNHSNNTYKKKSVYIYIKKELQI